jgi:hypothetical protein
MKSPTKSNTQRAAVDHQRLVRLGLMRGLVIRQPHIGHIMDGMKSWEMRSTPTKIRGRVGLIEAGSGLIVGEAEIARMQEAPKSYRARHMTRCFHRIPEERYHVMDKWKWAWVLEQVLRYDEPVAYAHPQGAVIWVSLPNS